jgi:hypothetical protein
VGCGDDKRLDYKGVGKGWFLLVGVIFSDCLSVKDLIRKDCLTISICKLLLI